MSVSRWIVEHPKIVIAIWIIALILVTPLAIMLNQVLTYEETAFLPENTESAIVDKILQEKFGLNGTLGGEGNRVVLIITGIDAGSGNARRAYEELRNKVLDTYVSDIDSYYDEIDRVNEIADNISDALGNILVNMTFMTLNMSDMLSERYSVLIENTSMMYNMTRMLYTMITNTSTQYNMVVEQLNYTKQQLEMLRQALEMIDYSALEANNQMQELYIGMHNMTDMINQSVGLLQLIRGICDRTYYDVLRTYYYLSTNTTAYQTGNLSQQDIALVIQITNQSVTGPVDPMIIQIVFQSTYPIIGNNTWAMNDLILYNISNQIAYQTITMLLPSDPLIREYVDALYTPYTSIYRGLIKAIENDQGNTLLTVLATGNPYNGQLLLLQQITGLSENALRELEPVIEQLYIQSSTSMGYSFPDTMAETLANKTIELALGEINETVVDVAIELFQSMLPENMSLPMEVLYSIYYNGVTQDFVWSIVETQVLNLSSELGIPCEYLESIVDTVEQLDPQCIGVLVGNETLLENVTIDMALNLMPNDTQFPMSPRTLLETLYNTPVQEIPVLAKEVIREGLLAFLSNATEISMPREQFVEIVNVVVDSLSLGEQVNATEIILEIYGELFNVTEPCMLRIVTISLVKSFDEVIDDLVNPMFKNMTLTYMAEYMGNVSNLEDLTDIVEDIIDYIVESYPDYSDLHNYTADLLVERFREEFVGRAGVFRDVIDIDYLIHYIASNYGRGFNAVRSDVVKIVGDVVRGKLYEIMSPMLSVFKSSDNTTILIQMEVKGSEDKEIYDNAMEVREVALDIYGKYYDNVEAYVSGGSVSRYELKNVGRGDVDLVRRTSVILTLLVLFIVLESLLAVLFPFLGIGAAIWVASGILYLIATNVTDISSWAQVLMFTTSLGLGIDYTTYYIHRFKELRMMGLDKTRAAEEALKRARDGILASASTDIIGFAALLIAWDFPFIRTIGIAVPIAIAMVFIASLTLTPAIVVLASGSKIFWWPKGLRVDRVVRRSKLVSWVARHKGAVLLAFIVLLIPATISYVTFSGSHDITIYLPQGSQTEKAYLLIRDKIGASTISPVVVILEFDHRVNDNDLVVIEDVCRELADIDHVSIVYSPTRPYGSPLENLTLEDIEAYNGTLYIGSDNRTIMIRMLLDVPSESTEAINAVKQARNILAGRVGRDGIVEAYVGGMPAALVDLDELLDTYFWHRIIPVSVVLMFIALALSLRGIPAAAITMATIYLGITGSIWLSSMLFTGVFGKPMLWFLPLVTLVVLLGIGVDYNSFFLVRVRDEMEHQKDVREALALAAGSSARMIIGLALILASSYAGLLFTRMWAMREMGFVLLTGVILIAISAVYFLTPAFIALTGEKTYWPFRRRRGNG